MPYVVRIIDTGTVYKWLPLWMIIITVLMLFVGMLIILNIPVRLWIIAHTLAKTEFFTTLKR